MSDLTQLLRRDLPASIVVFLIAIPLSLGIAAASGAPLLAGLVAAVVGGIVAGALGGAPLQVSGPAAGLTVIVAGTVANFGFAGTAAIVAVAGLIQIILGASRMGRAALALSPAVVHGMLAGIGLVIALSQIHVMLGGAPQSSAWQNLRELPTQIAEHHGVAAMLGAFTVAILILWPRLEKILHVKLSLLPAALVAVVSMTALASVIGADVERVNLPDEPLAGLIRPAWPDAPLREILVAVVTIALVASVESLLSAVAVDRMHDGPRANLNRELVGQGAANTVSGLLGGLPVTGVIVRSSTNVAAGARTRASAIMHGVWIAAFVLFFAGLLETIPMAVLAAVLIVVGLRLVSLAQIRTYARHRELPTYLVTLLGVVLTDLLTGVALGMITAAVMILWRLTRCEIRRVQQGPGQWQVTITGTLSFVESARLIRELGALPPAAEVELELHLDYLDHGAFETVRDWREGYERTGGRVRIREVHDSWFRQGTSGRLGSGKRTPGLTRAGLVGSWSRWQGMDHQRRDAMAAGIAEFERAVAPLVRPHLADLARDGQRPEQLFITCADSRLVPNLITASGPGDLFCVRNVGNIVPPHDEKDTGQRDTGQTDTGQTDTGKTDTGKTDTGKTDTGKTDTGKTDSGKTDAGGPDSSVGAAIEYAVDVLGVTTITVCGHSGCGAVRAIMGNAAEKGTDLGDWLALSGVRFSDSTDEQRCCTDNVTQQLANLRTYPTVRAAEAAGRLRLTGMYFDLAEARMYEVDPDLGARPVTAPGENTTQPGANAENPVKPRHPGDPEPTSTRDRDHDNRDHDNGEHDNREHDNREDDDRLTGAAA
ncbi:putative sulphate transporter and carbonic anhidrase [Actinoplanes missouriensis 431]|uniref:carbonic anhydrase n=1 Tax=Actinoplanes missouriensis (strain ATCC 14538 / DSM 43046 / CBS 188.64 / JCM 3121 / NBRC 102363 / NCIMB 12654 / NRRL B-3342 / UNCC 431) TaxID=512565 RepID=I0HFM7_ACTM4|nr:bifunctional SulP family inorganic anion transporter/carbonic anhydrase [Actinoplanes missouriensis]BAL91814.1 putative sulphate transporter and carbonic anhidrase [Actinoplanes missouriensis 431]